MFSFHPLCAYGDVNYEKKETVGFDKFTTKDY